MLRRFARESEKRDPYYRSAKHLGLRARSAFKLLHIHELFRIFDGVTRAVDLCAAPGSWSQVLAQQLHAAARSRAQARAAARTGAAASAATHSSTHADTHAHTHDHPSAERKSALEDAGGDRRPDNTAGVDEDDTPIIISVDLQQIAPIDGVITLQGDITARSTCTHIHTHTRGKHVDLVVCDGAPDVTGTHDLDEYVHSQLLLAAVNITTHVLRPGGAFVAKVFTGTCTHTLTATMRHLFKNVHVWKPTSSRARSAEAFLVCQDYAPPPGFVPTMEPPAYGTTAFNAEVAWGGSATNRWLVPFLACGDLSGAAAVLGRTADDGPTVETGGHAVKETGDAASTTGYATVPEDVMAAYMKKLTTASNSDHHDADAAAKPR